MPTTYYSFDEETLYDDLIDCVESFRYDVDPGEYKIERFEGEPYTHESIADETVHKELEYFNELAHEWCELSEHDIEYLKGWQKLKKEDFDGVKKEIIKLMEQFPPPRTIRITKRLDPTYVLIDENGGWIEIDA